MGAHDRARRIARAHGVLLGAVIATYRGMPRIIAAKRELWSLLGGTFGLSDCEVAAIVERDHTTIRAARVRRERDMDEELSWR